MKSCDDLSQARWAHVLGAAEGLERDELDAHLLGCRACLEQYLSTRRVADDAAAFDDRPAAPVRERLRSAVAARSPQPRRLGRWALPLAAAAAVVAMLAVRAWRETNPPRLDPPAAAASRGWVDSAAPMETDVL